MRHYTEPRFWRHYQRLPAHVQKLADENFQLLKRNPNTLPYNSRKLADTGLRELASDTEPWRMSGSKGWFGFGLGYMVGMTDGYGDSAD